MGVAGWEGPSTARIVLGEALGTYLMVALGTGAVATAVLTDMLPSLWQIATVWGIAVTLAIFAVRGLSGAHLNPAVTLALAVFWKDVKPVRLLAYWSGQMTGAVLAGLTVLGIFGSKLREFEAMHGLERGGPGSELSAMVFGEYFPNPGMYGAGDDVRQIISPLGAAGVEAVGTAILVFVIFLLTAKAVASPSRQLATPFLIGLTVALLIYAFAPLTQAGWNPARDFGPRVVAFFAGWGSVAIPGPNNGFWVYILGPFAGGLAGAGAYGIGRWLRQSLPSGSARATYGKNPGAEETSP